MMIKTKSRIGISAIVAGVFFLSLSGCGLLGLDGPPDEKLSQAINEAIDVSANEGEARVDFSEVVDGEWDRMIIVCGGTASDLAKKLGFEWDEMPDLQSPNFLSLGVFASDSTVVDFFQTGLDDNWVDQWYFTFCSDRAGFEADPSLREVQIVLPREQAIIDFTSGDAAGNVYWYVTPEDLAALVAEGMPFEGNDEYSNLGWGRVQGKREIFGFGSPRVEGYQRVLDRSFHLE